MVTSLYGDFIFVVKSAAAKEQPAADAAAATQTSAAGDAAKPQEPALTVSQVFVKIGRRQGAVSEIISGIEPGQKVVVSGQNKLQSGAVVKIDNSIDVTKVAERR